MIQLFSRLFRNNKFTKRYKLNEQVDLLHGLENFEFPKKNLKLIEKLESGEYGEVYKASAQQIKPNENETIVAVKTIKDDDDYEELQALESELKILVNLGLNKLEERLNIVNLLGTVTKNGEIMIILEYCEHGNLKNYLEKNCQFFDYESGHEIEQTFSYDSTSECTNRITTRDLLNWSNQVASGMRYLASQKVIHRDLMAKNILLHKDNSVKISNFGLARSIYRKNYYRGNKMEALPIKWLAPETITDNKFTTSSDVWSFGIVLWEIFSLGEEPYPDDSYDDVIQKLESGKSFQPMEKPERSPQGIYDIMLFCWQYIPADRPSFNELEMCISTFLSPGIIDNPNHGQNMSVSRKQPATLPNYSITKN